jgi:hypothetical protein
MSQVDFLEAQLAQARSALEMARRLQQAAEEQRNAAVAQLRAVAAALLAPEWNALKREHPEAVSWPPEQLGAWIVEAGTRKMNRLELSGGSTDLLESVIQERDRWQREAEGLSREVERITREKNELAARLRVRDEETQRLREENARLQQRIAELALQVPRESRPSGGNADTTDPSLTSWVEAWKSSPDYARDVEALRVIGLHGYVLRESVAKALQIDPRSGTSIRLFERIRDAGLVEERSSRAEGRGGKSPNLLSLTEKGCQVYRMIFGTEPVEPEDARLLRRHKSEEQVMLALQARTILEAHNAELIDLFPEPQPLPNGDVFEVDLIAVLDGQKVFVELERAPRGLRRVEKWNRYKQITRAFYFFVPNKDTANRLMTELNYWAYHHSDQAEGVVVHICQVSEAKDGELWHIVRPLVGKSS